MTTSSKSQKPDPGPETDPLQAEIAALRKELAVLIYRMGNEA